jgi:protein-disulfide isomerase
MSSDEGQNIKKTGCAIVGWAVFLLLALVLGLFGYRTFHYYMALKAGDIVELPDSSARLTFSSEQAPPPVAQAEISIDDQPLLGPAEEKAAVTVVMFGDYECPFSKESASVFRRMAVLYGEQVRFAYRDYPIQLIHPRSFEAALAAECAREQRRFWEYFDRLYADSPDLSPERLLQAARTTGLDERQFEACLKDRRYEAQVVKDLNDAERLGLRGTPTFYFDGRRVEGSIPADDFEKVLKKMIEKSDG